MPSELTQSEFKPTMTKQTVFEVRKSFLRWGLPFALLVLVLFWFYRTLPLETWSNEAMVFADRHGAIGAFAFALIYLIASLAMLPCGFLTIAAGMMYGYWGIPLVLLSATIAAVFAFWFARRFLASRAERLLQETPYGSALRSAIAEEGWLFMVLLRVSPLIPFPLNNYILGTLPVHFGSYISSTFIGALPGTLLYIYLGTFGRTREQAFGPKMFLLAFGLAATVLLARITLQRTKAILAKQQRFQLGEEDKA